MTAVDECLSVEKDDFLHYSKYINSNLSILASYRFHASLFSEMLQNAIHATKVFSFRSASVKTEQQFEEMSCHVYQLSE